MAPSPPGTSLLPALAGLACVAALAAAAARPPLLLEQLEGRVYDALLRSTPSGPPSGVPLVVDIDEESLARHGQWPWPRYRVAELIERTRDLGAAAVGLDIVFPEPDRTSLSLLSQELERDLGVSLRLEGDLAARTDNDRTLAATLARGGTVLGYAIAAPGQRPSARCALHPIPLLAAPGRDPARALPEAPGFVCSLPPLAEAAGASGFFSLAPDADGTVRRLPAAVRHGGAAYPSLPVALVARSGQAGSAALEVGEDGAPRLRLDGRRVPLDARGNILMRFRGEGRAVASIPAAAILAGGLPPGALAGRIVIVGTSAAGLKDLHTTPLGPAVPGPEILAAAIDTILVGDAVRRPPGGRGAEIAALLVLGALGSLLFARLGARWGLPALGATSAALWGGAYLLLAKAGVFASPLLAQAGLAAAFVVVASLRHARSERAAAEFSRRLGVTQDVIIQSMAALAETRDNETGGHIQRTRHYVRLLAERLRAHPRFCAALDAASIELLFRLAPLHDIGKVGVRDSVLLKPARLTPEEFEEMKKHTVYGDDTLEIAERNLGDDSFLRVAREFALTHQEKWDGSGYPQGLRGEQIPVAGRLMAVADVYDALVSRRAYKAPLPHEEAERVILAGRGTHFDPDVVDAFLVSRVEFRAIAARFADGSGSLRRGAARDRASP